MEIKLPKAICAGIIFVVLGLATFIAAQSYTIGTVTRMGSGYIPACIGVLLVVFGIGTLVRAYVVKDYVPIGTIDVVPLISVTAGIILFGVCVEPLGLAAGVAVLVLCTCYGRLRSNPVETFATYLVLLAIAVSLFIYGLGLPLKIVALDF